MPKADRGYFEDVPLGHVADLLNMSAMQLHESLGPNVRAVVHHCEGGEGRSLRAIFADPKDARDYKDRKARELGWR